MTPQFVAQRIAQVFDKMPPRMRKVGSYVLDHPEDVALLSMREQARRAGVTPAAMTRFAQRLGYTGYDEMRGLFAASIRGRVSDFGIRAGELAARRRRLGAPTLARSLANALIERVAALAEAERLTAIVDAAALLAGARHILCLGHRSCYAPAYHFAYVAGLYGAPTRLLDAPGGIGADVLNTAARGDVMLAVSFAPYTRATIEIATIAHALGLPIVAVTDSRASPLAQIASRTVAVPTDLADATHVTAPAFAVIEMLAALVVAESGREGREVLERNESEFARRRIYWDDNTRAAP
jgi:DNA-binding MurR/RpiR family transcriptional regulator